MPINCTSLTMSSREISELTSKRHDNVKRMMLSLKNSGVITFTQIEEKPTGGRPSVSYLVNKRDSYVVVAQLSPEFTARLVDRWQELESDQKPMTSLEIIAANAQALVDMDRVQKQQQLMLDNQQKKIDELENQQFIMNARPSNTENITAIRARINAIHGLPAWVVNEVLHSLAYSPKPAGQVRNMASEANGATYTVWYKADVTRLFKRFVSECSMVTDAFAIHDAIDKRFMLREK